MRTFHIRGNKIVSYREDIYSSAFEELATSLRRSDHHIPADEQARRRREPEQWSDDSLQRKAWKAPFSVNKYKGQYTFRLGVPKETAPYETLTESQLRHRFRELNYAGNHTINPSEEELMKWARERGFVLAIEATPEDERIFVSYHANTSKFNWDYRFADDTIYVQRPAEESKEEA